MSLVGFWRVFVEVQVELQHVHAVDVVTAVAAQSLILPGQNGAIPITIDTLRGRTDAVALMAAQAIIGEPGVTALNAGGVPFDQFVVTYGRERLT